MVGMALTFTLLALVPLSVISLNGLENISDVATISWGRALGEWAFFSANLFALCAMLTSYWGLGGSFLTNIFDQFRLGNDEQPARRLMVLLVVAIPRRSRWPTAAWSPSSTRSILPGCSAALFYRLCRS